MKRSPQSPQAPSVRPEDLEELARHRLAAAASALLESGDRGSAQASEALAGAIDALGRAAGALERAWPPKGALDQACRAATLANSTLLGAEEPEGRRLPERGRAAATLIWIAEAAGHAFATPELARALNAAGARAEWPRLRQLPKEVLEMRTLAALVFAIAATWTPEAVQDPREAGTGLHEPDLLAARLAGLPEAEAAIGDALRLKAEGLSREEAGERVQGLRGALGDALRPLASRLLPEPGE